MAWWKQIKSAAPVGSIEKAGESGWHPLQIDSHDNYAMIAVH